ncbi:MAG: hypothetical protein WBP03_04810 [Candidatus Saccharimonadales bacterium]
MKNHKVLRLHAYLDQVSVIYFCPDDCKRALVTYFNSLAATHHSEDLPPEITVTLHQQGKRFVPTHCDSHGGVPYKPNDQYPNPPLLREQGRILGVAVARGLDVSSATEMSELFADTGITPEIFERQIVRRDYGQMAVVL